MDEINECKLMQVIYIEFTRGDGTEENPCRIVKQYRGIEGEFLAENDPCKQNDIIYKLHH